MIQEYLNSIDNFIIVGDRVLIKPRDMETHTRSGLVLPASVKADDTKYIGMQATEGDFAIFLKSRAHEIEFENEKYIIVPHSSILLLIRDELEI